MANYHLPLLLFHLIILIIAPTLASTAPPPPPPPPLQQRQLNNIIDALIGAGDFYNWANMLSASELLSLPLSATFFVPSDDSLFHLPTSSTTTTAAAAATTSIDPFIIPYHIVPQRLSFSDLHLLKPLSRLPTLLPSKSIIVTNTSISNFTLDGSLLSSPDLYISSSIAVHGIATLLDYTVYGGGILPLPPPPPSVTSQPLIVPPGMFIPSGEVIDDGQMSNAACLRDEFPAVFLVIACVVLAIKIYWY